MAKKQNNKLKFSRFSNKNKKLAIITVMVFGLIGLYTLVRSFAAVPGVQNFSDTPKWAKDAIEWISHDNGTVDPMMTGYKDKTFKPNRNISRAQFASALYKFNYESATDRSVVNFSDNPKWASDAIYWIAGDPSGPNKPIMSGYSDGTFRPSNKITRAQFARAMYRYAGEPEIASDARSFLDSPKWASDAIKWITTKPESGEQIMAGYESGGGRYGEERVFKPNDAITRAQFARALYRYAGEPKPGERRIDNKLYLNVLKGYDIPAEDIGLLERPGNASLRQANIQRGGLGQPKLTNEEIHLDSFIKANEGKTLRSCIFARTVKQDSRSMVIMQNQGNSDAVPPKNYIQTVDNTEFKEICAEVLPRDDFSLGVRVVPLGYDNDPEEYPFESPVEVDWISLQAL